MRRLIVVFILFIAPALGQAQSAPDAEIRDIITRQLEAFQQDDFATAFTFASPALQGIFQTPERFGDMVTGDSLSTLMDCVLRAFHTAKIKHWPRYGRNIRTGSL